MTEPGLIVNDRPRRAHRAVLLLLVALTAVAGWAVAPSGATAARAGTPVVGAVVKHAGPVAARATRGPLATTVARSAHHVTQAQRTLTTELGGTHGGPLLVVLAALVALALTGRRTGVLRSATSFSDQRLARLRRGRAPPTGVPTPA